MWCILENSGKLREIQELLKNIESKLAPITKLNGELGHLIRLTDGGWYLIEG